MRTLVKRLACSQVGVSISRVLLYKRSQIKHTGFQQPEADFKSYSSLKDF